MDDRIVTGEVGDALTGTPIEDAEVRAGGAVGFTDASGQFVLETGGRLMEVAFGAPGYLDASREGVRPEAELRLELFPADPDPLAVESLLAARTTARELLRDSADDPALRPEVAAFLRGELPESALLPATLVGDGEVRGARLALGAPPATVRIWRRSIDGAAASCDGRIDIIPLEDYVKGVLPHEWITSWHDESLRAGSLAIRTYVWNWVLRGGKYDCADLDDTTRSQVYRDDRVARASAAVDTTTGQGVTRSGSLVSGEYSAENSSPTADGVTDSVCAGRSLLGHGRGMCQWGTQRWALEGRDHVWMAGHYWPGAIVEGGTPPGPDYDAELVGMDHPAEMIAGERAVVWVELRNTGRTAWDLDRTRLGTTMPRDHESRYYDTENWMSPNRASGPDHSTYGPGDVGRFTFMVTAPVVTEPMMVTDTFGLVEEGVTWFGPEDISIEIMVRPPEGVPTDVDGDGFFAASDCDDSDPARHPGATDACGDGVDADCDGEDACPPGPGGDDPEIPIVPGPGDDPDMRRPGGVSGGCATTGPADLPPLALLLLALLTLPRRRR